MAESALLIEVPEAEPFVGHWRLAHDPVAARGVPAHITVLFPFRDPAHLDNGVCAQITELAQRMPSFDYSLTRVAEFPGVVWLAPEPADLFVSLTTAAMAAFPDCPPYGGAHPDITPHLTVAHMSDADLRDRVEADVRLPIHARATHLALYCSDDSDSWTVLDRFPLRS